MVVFAVPDDNFKNKINLDKIEAIPLSEINKQYVRAWLNFPIFPNQERPPWQVKNKLSREDMEKLSIEYNKNEHIEKDNDYDNIAACTAALTREFAIWIKYKYRPIGENNYYYFWSIIKRPKEFIVCGESDCSFRDSIKEFNKKKDSAK